MSSTSIPCLLTSSLPPSLLEKFLFPHLGQAHGSLTEACFCSHQRKGVPKPAHQWCLRAYLSWHLFISSFLYEIVAKAPFFSVASLTENISGQTTGSQKPNSFHIHQICLHDQFFPTLKNMWTMCIDIAWILGQVHLLSSATMLRVTMVCSNVQVIDLDNYFLDYRPST